MDLPKGLRLLAETQPVTPLLDTGSPVTILSLNIIENRWVQLKKEGQTKEQWKEELRNQLQAPRFVLRNYGGGEPNIFKETSVKLERDGHSCTAVVLLQKNSPNGMICLLAPTCYCQC